MAYGNYFPATYQPGYFGQPNPYAYQQMQQMMQAQQQTPPQQPQQMQQPTIQQSGFVLVQSEQEARAYPVAPGNSITFKDESQPYCYVKTMGFNQLDRPTFERYRLVKEDFAPEARETPTANASGEASKNIDYATKSDLTAIWDEIDTLKDKLRAQVEKKPTKKRSTEVETEDISDD